MFSHAQALSVADIILSEGFDPQTSIDNINPAYFSDEGRKIVGKALLQKAQVFLNLSKEEAVSEQTAYEEESLAQDYNNYRLSAKANDDMVVANERKIAFYNQAISTLRLAANAYGYAEAKIYAAQEKIDLNPQENGCRIM